MVLIRIEQERVVYKRFVEFFVQIKESDNIHLQRVGLVEEPSLEVSVIAVCYRNDVSRIFRTALIVISQVYISTRYCSFEESVWKWEEFRKAQTCGYSEFV